MLKESAVMKTRMLQIATAGLMALSSSAFAAELNTLSDLRVLPAGHATQVVVSGNKAPTFTVFRLSDPDRLVVDVSTADAAAIKGHHEGTGAVSGVVVSQFSDERASVGRVLVALNAASTYDVRADGNKVVISVSGPAEQKEQAAAETPKTPEHAEAAKAEVTPAQKGDAKGDAKAEVKTEARPEQGEVAKAEAKPEPTEPNVLNARTDELKVTHPAKMLKAVALEKDRLRIVTDGQIARFDVLELADPPRLAIDLMELGSTAKAPRGKNAYVSSVRLGAHEGKVRLVLDLSGQAPFEVERTSRGVDLWLGNAALSKRAAKEPKTAVAAAQPAAKQQPAEQEEAADAEAEIDGQKIEIAKEEKTETQGVVAKPPEVSAPAMKVAEVKDISFDDDAEGGTLSIKLSGDATASVERPDPRSAVLTLSSAQMPKRLERSLDTSALQTPVKMISAFTVPGAEKKVRIVVAASGAFDGSVESVSKTKDGLRWRLNVGDKKNEQAVSENKTAGFSSEAEVYASESTPRQGNHRYTGKKVTFEFKDIDIHNLLRIIAEVSKKNIVVADDVAGRITIRLRNVPWDQALDLILRSKGLGMESFGNNIIRIAPLKTLEDEAKSREARREAQKKLEPLTVQLIPVNYAKAEEMSSRVKSILSERGGVEVDSRTNVLIVKDTAGNIAKARSLVQNLDAATPQVLIESRIVEANTTYTRQLGIQWGGNGQLAPATGNATGLVFPNIAAVSGGAGQAPSAGTADTPNYAVNLPVAAGQGVGGALGFLFGSAGGALNLNLRLSALENQGAVKTISSPKVTTLDNNTARISQGVSLPFSQASAQGVNTTFVEARLSLEVKPHITQDGSVMMDIRAENNQPDPSNTGSNGQPAIQRKEAQTQVLVKDGDTTVIGGIYVKTGATSQAGLPFFSKIPILGYFFRSTSELETRQELLIFITPRIINRQVISQTL
ncbi:MAG: type IV pilus secretin PilQ [Myxococcaceae bacterium]